MRVPVWNQTPHLYVPVKSPAPVAGLRDQLRSRLHEEWAMKRRSATHATSLKDFLDKEAKAFRALADRLVPSVERDALLRKAQQAETASQFVEWLSSWDRDNFPWAQRRQQ